MCPGIDTPRRFHAIRSVRRSRLSRAADIRRRAAGIASTSRTTTIAPPSQFTFNRFDADLRQFFGFLAGRRVIAARLFVSTSDTDAGQTMPFYFMPTLGGNDTLRGFREYRFRGPHAILAQAEYRWEIWSGFDGALFYDAGKVADRRGDLNFKDLETRLRHRVPLQHQ